MTGVSVDMSEKDLGLALGQGYHIPSIAERRQSSVLGDS